MDVPYDLVVVGGGVIGGAVAERMRDSGERICVVEMRPELGRGASSAAIGGINPHLGDHCLGPLGEMAQRSRALFPDWVARIAAKARM
ncbi:FAD-dependent oxidoreductase, partial [Actinomadura adrarensis]